MELFFLLASLAALSISGTLANHKQYRLSVAAAAAVVVCFAGYGLALWNVI